MAPHYSINWPVLFFLKAIKLKVRLLFSKNKNSKWLWPPTISLNCNKTEVLNLTFIREYFGHFGSLLFLKKKKIFKTKTHPYKSERRTKNINTVKNTVLSLPFLLSPLPSFSPLLPFLPPSATKHQRHAAFVCFKHAR